MAYTYTWNDVVNNVTKLLKTPGGFADVAVQFCDYVSNDMYIEYPWKDTITTVASNILPLLDGIQDYSSPVNIYRLTRASIVRYDVTPVEWRDLDVVDDNAVDLVPRKYTAVNSISQQQGSGTLRLEAAIQVPPGTLMELRGEYQLNPTKVAALTQTLWFKDQYIQTAAEGLLYWGYKFTDDPRAGTAQTDGNGLITGMTGQLAVFKSALGRMRKAEDWGASSGLFPGEPMGVGRDVNSLWGW